MEEENIHTCGEETGGWVGGWENAPQEGIQHRDHPVVVPVKKVHVLLHDCTLVSPHFREIGAVFPRTKRLLHRGSLRRAGNAWIGGWVGG